MSDLKSAILLSKMKSKKLDSAKEIRTAGDRGLSIDPLGSTDISPEYSAPSMEEQMKSVDSLGSKELLKSYKAGNPGGPINTIAPTGEQEVPKTKKYSPIKNYLKTGK